MKVNTLGIPIHRSLLIFLLFFLVYKYPFSSIYRIIFLNVWCFIVKLIFFDSLYQSVLYLLPSPAPTDTPGSPLSGSRTTGLCDGTSKWYPKSGPLSPSQLGPPSRTKHYLTWTASVTCSSSFLFSCSLSPFPPQAPSLLLWAVRNTFKGKIKLRHPHPLRTKSKLLIKHSLWQHLLLLSPHRTPRNSQARSCSEPSQPLCVLLRKCSVQPVPLTSQDLVKIWPPKSDPFWSQFQKRCPWRTPASDLPVLSCPYYSLFGVFFSWTTLFVDFIPLDRLH